MRCSRRRIRIVVLALVAMVAFIGLRAPAAFAQGADTCPPEATVPSL